MKPSIIIVSGSSSAGKSTLVRHLQEELLPEVWLGFSFDTVIYTLPPSVLDRCNRENDWSGVNGSALYQGSLASLRGLLESGNKVIYDVVLTNQADVEALKSAVERFSVVSVHLHCGIEELKKRATQREDRTLEETESSYANSLPFSDTSLVIDTTHTSPSELARMVNSLLRLY